MACWYKFEMSIIQAHYCLINIQCMKQNGLSWVYGLLNVINVHLQISIWRDLIASIRKVYLNTYP
jgi:hypothetical protein